MIIRWSGGRTLRRQFWLLPAVLPFLRTLNSGVTLITPSMGLGHRFVEPGGSLLLTRHAIHVG